MDNKQEQGSRERAADFAARHFRWNFGVLIVDAMAFWSGWALFDNETVLPVLLSKLGAADWVIGLLRLVMTLGLTLPALLAAHYIHGRESHKKFLLWACGAGRLGLITLPPLLFASGISNTVTIACLFVVIAVFWLFDGGCAVSWFDIIAKTIPPRVRGRFFGMMQLGGGIASLGAAAVVTTVLNSAALPFPRNFALLAVGWCVMSAVSQVCLSLIREPSGTIEDGEEKPGFAAYLRQAGPLLARRPRLVRLIVGRLLLDGAGMALPFYVLFAEKQLGVGLGMVGLYVFYKAAGRVTTGPLWGWLSDKYHPVIGLRGVAYCVSAIPLLGILAGRGAGWAMPMLFFFIGAMSDGLWMTSSNTLLESVAEKERPLAVGVASICQAPGALYGVIGGLLAQQFSYSVVFAIALGFGLAGLLTISGLKPVRDVGREIVEHASKT